MRLRGCPAVVHVLKGLFALHPRRLSDTPHPADLTRKSALCLAAKASRYDSSRIVPLLAELVVCDVQRLDRRHTGKGCGDNPTMKSNASISAEVRRLVRAGGILRTDEVIGCRNPDCCNHGLPIALHPKLYRKCGLAGGAHHSGYPARHGVRQ